MALFEALLAEPGARGELTLRRHFELLEFANDLGRDFGLVGALQALEVQKIVFTYLAQDVRRLTDGDLVTRAFGQLLYSWQNRFDRQGVFESQVLADLPLLFITEGMNVQDDAHRDPPPNEATAQGFWALGLVTGYLYMFEEVIASQTLSFAARYAVYESGEGLSWRALQPYGRYEVYLTEAEAQYALMLVPLGDAAFQLSEGRVPASLMELEAHFGFPFPLDPFTGQLIKIQEQEGLRYAVAPSWVPGSLGGSEPYNIDTVRRSLRIELWSSVPPGDVRLEALPVTLVVDANVGGAELPVE